MKQHEVAPRRVLGVASVAPVTGPPPALVRQEETRQTAGQLVRHLAQAQHPSRAGRALDLQPLSVEVVVALEGLDQEEVEREPHRTPPVRVAAEQDGVGLLGLVAHSVLGAAGLQHERMLAVDARQRAHAPRRQELVLVEHARQHALESVARSDRQQAVLPFRLARRS